MANEEKMTTKHFFNHIYGVYMGIVSNNNLHHIALYNDKRDSSVSITLDNTGLKLLADFLNEVVEKEVGENNDA